MGYTNFVQLLGNMFGILPQPVREREREKEREREREMRDFGSMCVCHFRTHLACMHLCSKMEL